MGGRAGSGAVGRGGRAALVVVVGAGLGPRCGGVACLQGEELGDRHAGLDGAASCILVGHRGNRGSGGCRHWRSGERSWLGRLGWRASPRMGSIG